MTNPHTVLRHPRFLLTSLIGSLVVRVVSAVASLTTQIAVLGVLVSMLAGLVLVWLEEQQRRDTTRHELSALGRVVEALEEEPELAREFRRIGEAFQLLSEQTDPVFRQVATTKLLPVAEELGRIATGTIVFRETESWRTAYQDLLRSEKLKLYRSVAWVHCADYWQDTPGRQSMRENYDAINRGVIVERIIILPREFWLHFGQEAVRLAEDRWPRLKLHTIPLRCNSDVRGRTAAGR
jgi:hypothetical protein